MSKKVQKNLHKLSLSALPIGIVSAAIGYVVIKGQDGIEKLLEQGQKLFSGDEVVTGDGGHAVIDLIDGSKVELDDQSSIVLDDDVIDAKTLEQIKQALLDSLSSSEGSSHGLDLAQVDIDELTNAKSDNNDYDSLTQSDNYGSQSGQSSGPGDSKSGNDSIPDGPGSGPEPPDIPIGIVPSLSIADVTVQEPAPAPGGFPHW